MRRHFKHEKKFWKKGYDFVIGVDEAGRGPLAGPVVACAATVRNFKFSKRSSVYFNEVELHKFNLVRDSKTLSEKQREGLYNFILENFCVGIGIYDHKTIDRVNILQATFLAMKKAITSLKSKLKNQNSKLSPPRRDPDLAGRFIKSQKLMVLVDGNKVIPNFSLDQRAIVNGDKIVKSISAASIIAKVTRDRIMREMHKKYPQYGFKKHKGYGTRLHLEMIKKHGRSEIHRKSFKPF